MAEHGALATLKDLAEKEVEDAARLLGEMRRGCQQAEEQLKMLIDYQNEYRNNLNSDMSAGITSNRWINYQQFIQTLEKAITQHRQQLNQWTQKVDIALNSWREKNNVCRPGRHCRNGNPRRHCLQKTASIRKDG
ncbi:flagellar protein FliJ [Escherichia coli]|nr:flagellar protein FliJ [Escherichia coli]